jgi:predicted ArsR family transcriptional regulator
VTPPPLDPGLDALCVLSEPLRRALYRYVVAQRDPVSRNQAAEAVGAQRSLVAFHLDKLADAGLLEASFRRLNDRRGPGAGRPAKLYRRAEGDHEVSLPPRAYPEAAEMLAEVVDAAGADAALHAVARRSGLDIGQRARAALSATATGAPGPGPAAPGPAVTGFGGAGAGDPEGSRPASSDPPVTWAHLQAVLCERGFEPYRDGEMIRMQNCPFHRLARQFPPLICGMNLALVEGIVAGITQDTPGGEGDPELRAEMDPAPDRCCVAVRPG